MFYNRGKKYFRWCTLTYLAGWVFDTVEIMVGAQYAVVRRGRDVAFAVLGWLLLYVGEATWKSLRAETQTEKIS